MIIIFHGSYGLEGSFPGGVEAPDLSMESHCIYDSRYLCLAGGRKKISFIGMEVLKSAYFKNGIVLSCIFGIIAFQ